MIPTSSNLIFSVFLLVVFGSRLPVCSGTVAMTRSVRAVLIGPDGEGRGVPSDVVGLDPAAESGDILDSLSDRRRPVLLTAKHICLHLFSREKLCSSL